MTLKGVFGTSRHATIDFQPITEKLQKVIWPSDSPLANYDKSRKTNIDKYYPQRTILRHLKVFLVPRDMLKLIFNLLQKVKKGVSSYLWHHHLEVGMIQYFHFWNIIFFSIQVLCPQVLCVKYLFWTYFLQFDVIFINWNGHFHWNWHIGRGGGGTTTPYKSKVLTQHPPTTTTPYKFDVDTPHPHHHHPLTLMLTPPHHHHPSAQFCVQFLVTFWASQSLSLIEFHSIDKNRLIS